MTENKLNYWAFLSYSQQDNGASRPEAPAAVGWCWGDELHAALQNFSVPAVLAGQTNARGEAVPERIAPIFQDREEQGDHAGLSADVRQALEQSKCLVVICSPRSAASRHVNEAVRYFKQLGRGNCILPFVIAGEPHASLGHQPGEECFVPALRHPLKPDGTLDVARRESGSIFADARQGDGHREISAADHQPGTIEWETAKIQLIAGIIGVGFNGLWAQEIQRLFATAKTSIREVQPPTQQIETQALTAATSGEILEAQNQVRAAQQQIQELRTQTQAAQNQVIEAQQQAREALGQVAEARQQAQAAENKVLEAQQQARDAQTQLEAAREQVRAGQSQLLEVQNLPEDVKGQIEAARNQAQQAQREAEAARRESHASETKFLEAQNQVRAAQSQVQDLETRVRQTQGQLEAAQNQARLAEGKVVEAQQQAHAAQAKIQETQTQARSAEGQLEEARTEARAVQGKFLEAQNQVRAAQAQVQEIQTRSQGARRLTKIVAILAVLALMAAASLALWQQKKIAEAQAKAALVTAGEPAPAAGPLSREQIQQALQKFASAGHDANLLASLDELAARIPTEEIPETFQASSLILNDPPRSRFQGQLLDSWTKTNSPAAFDWSCQLTNVDFRQRALEKIIPSLAADHLTNTLARLNDLKPAPGEPVYTQLFQHWATQAPVQAIEQRSSIPGQDADGKMLSTILIVWAEQQPAAALNWLQSQPGFEALPAGSARTTLVAGLFEPWATNDLAAATTACQQLPESPAKARAWETVLNQTIASAPAAAAEPVKNLPPGDYRQKAILELCDHWVGATNAPAVLDWAQTLPSATERAAVTNQVVINWAKNDPAAATQFAAAHPELNGAVFGDLATSWFPRDAAATTNWVANLPEGEKKDAARLALMEVWSQNDPKGLLAYALALPPGDVQTLYLTAASSRLAVHDLPGTVERLQPLADAGLRTNILEQAARHCDASEFNPAAKFIATLPAGDDQKAAIKGLLASWAPIDPEAALNWLVSFPATNSQPELMPSIIKTWAQPEPAVVAKWLANLPAGTVSEAMPGAFLDGAVAKYPDYAAQWTQSVTDETQRQKYQVQVARQWLKTDAPAATKWIESLSWPEEIKQSLKAPSP